MTCSCYLLVCIGQKTHITFVDVGQYAAAMHLIDRYCWGGQGVIHVGLKLKFQTMYRKVLSAKIQDDYKI